MNRWTVVVALFALWLGVCLPAHSATNPDNLFFDAAGLARAGDDAEAKADWVRAYSKYDAALAVLRQLRTDHPEWNAHVVEFRIRTFTERLDQLKTRVPAGTAPEPAPPPAVDPARVKQLTDQLIKAEERLQQLETVRQELADKLTTAQNQIVAVQQQAADKESAILARANAEAAEIRQDIESYQKQLAEAQAQLTELRQRQPAVIVDLRDLLLETGASIGTEPQ